MPAGQFAGQYENKALWDIMVNRYKSTSYVVSNDGVKWTMIRLSD